MTEDIKQVLAEEAVASEAGAEIDAPLVRNRTRAKEPAQVYSLRIPVDHLEDLRQLAAARNVAPTALMRRWILDRLDVELARASDLEQRRAEVFAEHSEEPIMAFTQGELVTAVTSVIKRLVEGGEPTGRHAQADSDGATSADSTS